MRKAIPYRGADGEIWSSNKAQQPKPAQAKDKPRAEMSEDLPKRPLSDKLSDMKTIPLRSLRRNAELLDVAAGGEEILVTRFGKPYVRILPVKKSASFFGAGKNLGMKKPVSPEPIPAAEWRGLA